MRRKDMMRTLTTIGFLALLTATASADHAVYQRRLYAQPSAQYSSQQYSLRDAPQNQQPQTEARYQPRNKLADIGLAPNANRAYAQLPPYSGSLDYLELRAGRTPVELRDVVVRFADGTSIHTGSRGVVEPFEGRVIDLPRGGAPVVSVMPEYATSYRGARLELFGVQEHRTNDWRYSSTW